MRTYHTTRAITTAAGTTTAVVLIDPGGQRSFAYSAGATERMDRAVIMEHLDLFARSRMMLLGYYALLPNLEEDLPEVLAAIAAVFTGPVGWVALLVVAAVLAFGPLAGFLTLSFASLCLTQLA